MINYITGDAVRPQGAGVKLICHCVNDQGLWGSGFAKALSERWVHPEGAYRLWYKSGETLQKTALDSSTGHAIQFRLGQVQYVQVEEDIWVANIVGQHETIRTNPSPIRYDALEEGLQKAASVVKAEGWTAHMPRLGAGLARGRWQIIEALIKKTFVREGLTPTVYDLP